MQPTHSTNNWLLQTNGRIVRTRFPPEPNGYLHIGHAKSMNMNFSLAFEKLGVPPENRETIFRYDDTNPEAESKEYIENIREDVAWMGWNPVRTTYASDMFPELHALAVKLVESGNAYVCYQNSEQIEQCRDVPSHPNQKTNLWRQIVRFPDKQPNRPFYGRSRKNMRRRGLRGSSRAMPSGLTGIPCRPTGTQLSRTISGYLRTCGVESSTRVPCASA
jgi:glutamyl/glutaminyl-tRNA synthetase